MIIHTHRTLYVWGREKGGEGEKSGNDSRGMSSRERGREREQGNELQHRKQTKRRGNEDVSEVRPRVCLCVG